MVLTLSAPSDSRGGRRGRRGQEALLLKDAASGNRGLAPTCQATPSFPPLLEKGKVPLNQQERVCGAWVRGGGWPRRWRGSQADLDLPQPQGNP